MELGEFHWQGGWFWKRLEDGAVRVRYDGGMIVIPASQWASIVAHVAQQGEADAYWHAVALHEGKLP